MAEQPVQKPRRQVIAGLFLFLATRLIYYIYFIINQLSDIYNTLKYIFYVKTNIMSYIRYVINCSHTVGYIRILRFVALTKQWNTKTDIF